MELKDKIIRLIQLLEMSSSQFADQIGLKRPVLSHILTARNKPSLDIIQKIVDAFPELGYNWIGEDQVLDDKLVVSLRKKYSVNSLNFLESSELSIPEYGSKQNQISNSQNAKKISYVIVFYTDGTMQTYNHA
jgi:transcriptional regulator with XRE-family HTH domain